MKKPHATLAVLASALLCVGCGPDNTWQRHTECLITGTIPDSLSVQEVLLLPSTDRLESGIRIPVHDGRFEYLLQTDTLQLYELNVPCDHGSFYFIQFLPEAKGVRFEYSEAFEGEPIRMIAQGPLNRKRLERQAEERARFKPRLDSILDAQERLDRDNLLFSEPYNELIRQIQSCPDQIMRQDLYRQMERMHTTGSRYTEQGRQLDDEYQALYREQQRWLQEEAARHADLSSFCRMMEELLHGQRMSTKQDPAEWIACYDRVFADRFPGHPYHKRIESIRQSMKAGIGNRYIDFTLPDTEGIPTTLSEIIDGKVAVLDLWASWCGSCRNFSLGLIPLYEKYRDRGLVIVGVAREFKDTKDWHLALERDAYPWLNLLEMDDATQLWEQYGAGNAGGKVLLIGRDGKILAVNPTHAELEVSLEELL